METKTVKIDRESLSTCDIISTNDKLPAKVPKVKQEKDTEPFSLDGELTGTIAVCRFEKELQIPYFVELTAMAGARAIFLKENVLTKKIQARIPIFSIPANSIDSIMNATSAFVTFQAFLLSELGVEVNEHAFVSLPYEENKLDGDLKDMLETQEPPALLDDGLPDHFITGLKSKEVSAVLSDSEVAAKARFSFEIVLSSLGQHSSVPRTLKFISDCSNGEFLVGTSIEVTKPIIYRNAVKKLIKIVGKMKGKIVVCPLKTSFEIDKYSQVVCHNNAKAIFLTGGTTQSRFPIPIFVVPPIVNEYVQNMKSTQATFAFALTSNTTQIDTKPAIIGTESLPSSSYPSDDGVEESNKNALLRGAVSAVGNAFNRLFSSPSDLVNHLFRVVTWTKKCYIDAVGLLDTAVDNEDMSTITTLIQALMIGLGKPSNNPYLVALGAYTHTTLTQHEHLRLFDIFGLANALLC